MVNADLTLVYQVKTSLGPLLTALETYFAANKRKKPKRARRWGSPPPDPLVVLRDDSVGFVEDLSEVMRELAHLVQLMLQLESDDDVDLVVDTTLDKEKAITKEQLFTEGTIVIGMVVQRLAIWGFYNEYMQDINADIPPDGWAELFALLQERVPDLNPTDPQLSLIGQLLE